MALTLLRAYRSGGSVGDSQLAAVCAAPSGGFYTTDFDGSTSDSLVRVSAAGSIVWQKALTPSGFYTTPPSAVLSNANHVALLTEYTDPDDSEQRVNLTLYDHSGTLYRQRALPMGFNFTGVTAGHAAMNASSDVVVAGLDSATDGTIMTLVSGSTGNIVWAVQINVVGASSGVDWSGPVAFLSGGDVVTATLGPVHTSANFRVYLQRISATDGSVVWSRSVLWPVDNTTGLAVDPSDNIYLWGTPAVDPTGPMLPVVKVDSSGTTVWNRSVRSPTSQGSNPFELIGGVRGMANSSGVYIPVDLGPAPTTSLSRIGHLFVPAAGTGTGNVPISYFTHTGVTVASLPMAGGESGATHYFGYTEELSSATSLVLVGTLGSSAEDGTYGDYTRTTTTFDTGAGLATLATATFTRASGSSYSLGTNRTFTSGSGDVLIQALSTNTDYVALSLGVTTQFGTASCGYFATPLGPTTQFGTPSMLCRTTGFESSHFGTPTRQLLPLQSPATSMGVVTRFGDGWVYKDWTPESGRWAIWGEPKTAFGTATATSPLSTSASGWAAAQFGAPRARYPVQATGFVTGQFGAPTVVRLAQATGFLSTRLGSPAGQRVGAAQGFTKTQFGAPVARTASVFAASGFLATHFGGGLEYTALRARSAFFRTRFGNAGAERTAP